MFVGDGIIVADGEDHRRQRRILNPAFGPIPIREMCKTFVEKAKELKEGIEHLFEYDGQLGKEGDVKGRDYVETDMVSCISRAALDIIGLTGFNHSFDAVKSHSKKTKSSLSDDELYTALEEIYAVTQLEFRLNFLKIWIPWLRLWKWDRTSKILRRSHDIMNRIGKKLVDEKMQAIKDGIVDGQEKDLLTVLIKANLQEAEKKKMTEKEVMNQIPTFLIAGEFSHNVHRTRLTFPPQAHESTATAIVWALHSLSNDIPLQSRVRTEIQSLETDNPTMDELNSLAILENLVRETLRLHSVAWYLERMAYEDDVIPFDKPFTDRFGRERRELR